MKFVNEGESLKWISPLVSIVIVHTERHSVHVHREAGLDRACLASEKK